MHQILLQNRTYRLSFLGFAVFCLGLAASACLDSNDPHDDHDHDYFETTHHPSAHAGRWIPSTEATAASASQYISYDDPGAWNGGAGCTGSFTPGARALADQLVANTGASSYGGYNCRRNTGSPSNLSVHGTGRAIDLFIPLDGTEADNDIGDPIANWLVTHAESIGIQFIVWDRTAWSGHRSGRQDRAYGGPHPHHDHLHIELTIPASRMETPYFENGGVPGCDPGCDGSIITDRNCNTGDCAAYGSNCVDDNLGVRCSFFACPDQGTATVCLDQDTIITCNNGAIETGDCSAFAAYCSTAGGAQGSGWPAGEGRCVSAFCVDSPEAQPYPHQGCFLDGELLTCNDVGQIESKTPCPSGQYCNVFPEPHCETGDVCPPWNGVVPTSNEAAEAATTDVCVNDTVLGRCLSGAVVEATDCDESESYCSTAGGQGPRCVSRHCVSGPDDVPTAHDVCLSDFELGRCDANGQLSEVTACGENEVCATTSGGSHCEDPSTPGADTGMSTDTGPDPDVSSNQNDTGTTATPDAPTSETDANTSADTNTTTPNDQTDTAPKAVNSGCLQSSKQGPAYPGLLPWLIAGLMVILVRTKR